MPWRERTAAGPPERVARLAARAFRHRLVLTPAAALVYGNSVQETVTQTDSKSGGLEMKLADGSLKTVSIDDVRGAAARPSIPGEARVGQGRDGGKAPATGERKEEGDVKPRLNDIGLMRREKVTFRAKVGELPDGVLVIPVDKNAEEPAPRLIWPGPAWRWNFAGYTDADALDRDAAVDVLTPLRPCARLRPASAPSSPSVPPGALPLPRNRSRAGATADRRAKRELQALACTASGAHRPLADSISSASLSAGCAWTFSTGARRRMIVATTLQ